jgi:predicted SprT family Zn-dependent metalloprotease
MDTDEAVQMAEELLRLHGLRDWGVVIDRAKTRAGVCRSSSREIGLSGPLTSLSARHEVRETILHEIAHALVGPVHKHDVVWRAQAARLGCSTAACLPRDAPRVPAPWVGTCPAGHTVSRHRRPQRPASCSQCSRSYNADHLLQWQFRGVDVALAFPRAEQLTPQAWSRGAPAARSI